MASSGDLELIYTLLAANGSHTNSTGNSTRPAGGGGASKTPEVWPYAVGGAIMFPSLLFTLAYLTLAFGFQLYIFGHRVAKRNWPAWMKADKPEPGKKDPLIQQHVINTAIFPIMIIDIVCRIFERSYDMAGTFGKGASPETTAFLKAMGPLLGNLMNNYPPFVVIVYVLVHNIWLSLGAALAGGNRFSDRTRTIITVCVMAAVFFVSGVALLTTFGLLWAIAGRAFAQQAGVKLQDPFATQQLNYSVFGIICGFDLLMLLFLFLAQAPILHKVYLNLKGRDLGDGVAAATAEASGKRKKRRQKTFLQVMYNLFLRENLERTFPQAWRWRATILRSLAVCVAATLLIWRWIFNPFFTSVVSSTPADAATLLKMLAFVIMCVMYCIICGIYGKALLEFVMAKFPGAGKLLGGGWIVAAIKSLLSKEFIKQAEADEMTDVSTYSEGSGSNKNKQQSQPQNVENEPGTALPDVKIADTLAVDV